MNFCCIKLKNDEKERCSCEVMPESSFTPHPTRRYRDGSVLCRCVNSPSYSPGKIVRQLLLGVQASAVTNISQQKRACVWFTFSAVDSVHDRCGHHQLPLTLNILQWCLEIALPGARFITLTNLSARSTASSPFIISHSPGDQHGNDIFSREAQGLRDSNGIKWFVTQLSIVMSLRRRVHRRSSAV